MNTLIVTFAQASLMNRSYFAPLLAVLILFWSSLGFTQSKLNLPIEDAAFLCKDSRHCVYFFDLWERSQAFKQSLLSTIKRSAVTIHPSVYGGPSSPMTPVKIDGIDALIGSTCEKHNCPHTLIVIVYRGDFAIRTKGLYVDRSGRGRPLGQLTEAETVAVHNTGGYSVGERFDAPAPPSAHAGTPSTRIEVEELHKLAELGMPAGKKYAVNAYITGVSIGMTVLCRRSMGYGACEAREPQTRVYPELDRGVEAKLYDVRGNAGARVCALVSMWNDGKIRLLDFRPADCPSSW